MSALRKEIAARGITRVCHFTPSRNLVHILRGTQGVLATSHLAANERDVFNPTDAARFDGHTGHVCCSVQYPNAWYFRKARANEKLFADWVVLLLDASVLLKSGVKFCPRNAAAEGGRLAREGIEGMEAMYVARVGGAYGRTFVRSAAQPTSIPTDEQAEVLIPDSIPLSALLGVAVLDEEQAVLETRRLSQLELAIPPIVIAPLFFDADALSRALRLGNIPPETNYDADE